VQAVTQRSSRNVGDRKSWPTAPGHPGSPRPGPGKFFSRCDEFRNPDVLADFWRQVLGFVVLETDEDGYVEIVSHTLEIQAA